MKFRTINWLLCLGVASGCTAGDSTAPPVTPDVPADGKIEISVQEMRTGHSGAQRFLSMDVLTTNDGLAVPCNEGYLDITVSIANSPDGPFEALPEGEFEVSCSADESADVALVVDNSGSEEGFLPWLQEAAHLMMREVIGRGGRSSLVRVSTDSAVIRPLTDDEPLICNDVSELFINRGWTALYDGIRMGNETLGEAAMATVGEYDRAEFCNTDRKLGIVAFTDGRENNSSHQSLQSPEYPGDGIDTTLADLQNLSVGGVTTPIYTVGLGEYVDHDGLAELAAETGGRHHRVDDASDLPGVFSVISDYLESGAKVCTELPPDICGDRYVRVEYTWSRCDPSAADCDVSSAVSGSYSHEIHVDCPSDPGGKAATVLLTLSNPGIERATAELLVANTARYVSPVDAPRVLVVKDENHHGEFAQDAAYVHELLGDAGIDADFIDEPAGGLMLDDTNGYDVIWLSNPGYPIDDRNSLDTLAAFAEGGGGYVVQSDDGTWFFGDSGVSMASHTGLVHGNNGTRFCGKRIDNNATEHKYRVVFKDESHPVTAGLEGTVFFYGDDIDTSTPAGAGEEVLAWADGVDGSGEVYCETEVPVIVVRSP